MTQNMGSTEQKIRLVVGSAAAAVGMFAPLKPKWKGLLAFAAFSGLFTGGTRFSPFKKIFRIGQRMNLEQLQNRA